MIICKILQPAWKTFQKIYIYLQNVNLFLYHIIRHSIPIILSLTSLIVKNQK